MAREGGDGYIPDMTSAEIYLIANNDHDREGDTGKEAADDQGVVHSRRPGDEEAGVDSGSAKNAADDAEYDADIDQCWPSGLWVDIVGGWPGGNDLWGGCEGGQYRHCWKIRTGEDSRRRVSTMVDIFLLLTL